MPDCIGRYRILDELGSGAMGVVYRATDPTIGRTVALKTIRAELVGQGQGISLQHLAERFRNEARAAGSLNHRNIVTIYDAGEDQGTFFIAMEYLQGTTLQQLVAQRRSLPPDEVVNIGTQICAGLDYAHARGVVHRDIKPANIIITTDRTVKIMDFGIAKAEEALAGQLTMTGQIVGTPDYMSPEQVRGIAVDGRSDLFSLGVVLYQMTTGERPFPGDSITTVIYKIVHETPLAPNVLDSSVPAGLSVAITQALAKSPDARFQSARAMSEALRNYRSVPHTGNTATLETAAPPQQPPPARTGEAQPAIRGPSRSRRAILWPVAALVIAAGAILYSSRKGEQQPASSTAPPSPTAQPAPSASSQNPSTSPAASDKSSQPAQTPAVPGIPAVGEITRQATKLGEDISKSVGVDISPYMHNAVPSMTGELNVTSTPSGASVSVDGKGNGWKTPVHIPSVSLGAHEVVVTKPGYKPLSVTAPVTPGVGGAIKVKLVPEGSASASSAEVSGAQPPVPPAARKQTGTVVITSNPPGATIVLEQYGEGKTTPAKLTIPAGKHELVLTKQGYLPVTRNIDVKASAVTDVKTDLERVPGTP